MDQEAYVIVGGGVAAASAAEALRGEAFGGRIIILSEEAEAPYERPPLSKQLLRGEVDPASVRLRAPDFYTSNALELLLGHRVVAFDVAAHRIKCGDGKEIPYDKLLIATGAIPRRLAVEGTDLPGVHYLRWLNDALHLRNSLRQRPKVLVVGTGFIGCEVAASAKQVGCDVTLVGPSLPMEHVLGKEIAALYGRLHRDRGVALKLGVTATEFFGDNALRSVRLSDGTDVDCAVAIVGIGIVPNIGWLPAEIGVSDGVDTDEFCRTNVPNVFAAGDVACSWRPRLNRRVRLEHFDNAESQGPAAGRAMHGNLQPYDPVPFFWSDQYDLSLQYYGFAREWDRVVFRGHTEPLAFSAFYIKDGRIDAACTINQSRDANAIKRLIGKAGINPENLANESVSLKSLIPTHEYQRTS